MINLQCYISFNCGAKWFRCVCVCVCVCVTSLVVQMVKNPPAMQQTQVQSLGQEDPLEKGMATHSSVLTWGIPWMEEPGGLQSMGSQSRTRLGNQAHTHVCRYVRMCVYVCVCICVCMYVMRLPRRLSEEGVNLPASSGNRRHVFHPQEWNIPWIRKQPPTPVFLSEKFHGRRNLGGCGPWSRKEWDTTEQLSMHAFMYVHFPVLFSYRRLKHWQLPDSAAGLCRLSAL